MSLLQPTQSQLPKLQLQTGSTWYTTCANTYANMTGCGMKKYPLVTLANISAIPQNS